MLELLKENKDMKILMLDEGRCIKVRKCPKGKTKNCINCKPCNISCGFGGVEAFFDGKLSLSKDVGGWLNEYVGNDKIDDLIKYVDNIYLEYGGNPEVSYNKEFAEKIEYECSKYGLRFVKCPVRYLGTEKSQEIMSKMYDFIVSNKNTEVLDLAFVNDIEIKNNDYIVKYTKNKETIEVKTNNVVLAVGRSGSEWLNKLCKKNKYRNK